MTAGLLAVLSTLYLPGSWLGISLAGLNAASALILGDWLGDRRSRGLARIRFFRIADELIQYRAFTRLLRSQAERIAGMTGEAAQVIAEGLRDMDSRAERLSMSLNQAASGQCTAETLDTLKGEAANLNQPIISMVGKLQFQDVTQQQLMFLCRLSLLLDEHIGELCRLLGDRRSLERTSRFKELFEAALNDTVMVSQRNDHHTAQGLGLEESTGPAIELFADEGEVV